jgi:hypothetical protein
MISSLPAERRSDLETELLSVMQVAKDSVIVYRILTTLGKRFRLKGSSISDMFIALVISLLIWLVTWIANRIIGMPITSDEAVSLIIPSLLAGMGIWLIKVVEEAIFVRNMKLFAEMPADEESFVAFTNDFRLKFRFLPQFLFAMLFAILGVITALVLSSSFPAFVGNTGFYIGIFFASATIGIGAYFALMLPTIVVTIASHRVVLYPYNPAQSKVVQAGMDIIGRLTLGTGIAATAIMVLLFVANPWGQQLTFWISLSWLVFIWVLTTYTFILPFHVMSMAIVKEKQIQLERLSAIIDRYHKRLEDLSIDELNRLKELIELRQNLFRSKNSPIETSSVRDYLTSLILPTFSFFVGSYETLQEIIPFLRNWQL